MFPDVYVNLPIYVQFKVKSDVIIRELKHGSF